MKRWLQIALLLLFPMGLAAQQEVLFSAPGGIYDEAFELSLSFPNPSCQIHYTLNGNAPTVSDALYQGPMMLSEALYSSSDIYKIVIHSPMDDDFCPESVRHAIVIRAAAFNAMGDQMSKTTTHTYLVKALGCDTHGLPVISICADSLALFDYETGILVPGVYLDPDNPKNTGNYYQTGQDWERLCNVECYDTVTCHFNQQAGLRTHGESSRRFSQKGLKIYARKEYGKKRFEHTLFTETNLNSFKHLVLKPFCCSWTHAGVEDYLCDRFAKDLNVESSANCPVVLFLNGEYWGIYFLKEKPDERFLKDHFGVEEEDCLIAYDWDGHMDCGDPEAMLFMMDWLETNDLSDSLSYVYLHTLVDEDCFIDYMIFETFIKNKDWPANNMRCWQEKGGRWRWIFFDGDACLRPVEFDVFDNATYTGPLTYPSSSRSTLLFRKYLENDAFVHRFCQRYHELMYGKLAYDNTSSNLRRIEQQLALEIDAQVDRFHTPSSYSSWEDKIARIDKFLKERPNIVYNEWMCFLIDRTKVSGLSCYPNPTQGDFYLSFLSETAGLVPISIFNQRGQLVSTRLYTVENGENRISFTLSLPTGLYIVCAGGSSVKVVFY